jgi:hypothetical protein
MLGLSAQPEKDIYMPEPAADGPISIVEDNVQVSIPNTDLVVFEEYHSVPVLTKKVKRKTKTKKKLKKRAK